MFRIVQNIVPSRCLPVNNKSVAFCRACQLGKRHKLPFSYSSTYYNSPLELIVFNIWGHAPITSYDGFRYYIHFMDVFSRYIWIFPLASPSDALQTFIFFQAKIEIFLNCKLRLSNLMVGANIRNLNHF